jgi:hypothetical protein
MEMSKIVCGSDWVRNNECRRYYITLNEYK